MPAGSTPDATERRTLSEVRINATEEVDGHDTTGSVRTAGTGSGRSKFVADGPNVLWVAYVT